MKFTMLLAALTALTLSACERPKEVVAVPVPGPTAVVPVPVPGPAGAPGAPGAPGPEGEKGEKGRPGDTVVIVPQPPKSN